MAGFAGGLDDRRAPEHARALRESPWVRRALIGVVLAFLVMFLVVPLITVFASAFRDGVAPYVRALAEDFGKRLSVGAHLAELRRTRVGDFSLANAVSLEQLKTSFGEEALGTILLRPSAALSRLPFVHLCGDDVRRARDGMEVTVGDSAGADGATATAIRP